ncbi:coenzyme F420-0:L-glutamate ligase, partial [Candidatus Bathyarchaeota archaeon]|nr:coenzyme F420-0:L-glutamate ligase [Candidatus Bathyarchaeota archaeon]
MSKYKARAVTTGYWRPRDDYIEKILESVKNIIVDGDFVVVSEKAISTAMGNIIDESTINPGLSARILAKFWMRIIWGYLLGPLCHMQNKL